MVVLGILCGLICGIVLGTFRLLLEMPLTQLLPGNESENFEDLPTWLHFILPIVGSLILIAILARLTPKERKVGVIHLLERMAYHQSKIPLKNAMLQFLTAIIALLFGHSAGKEGPAVHLGATCGSQLGQRLNLPNNTLRILAGCGCAAGIAATFNTPLAGVVFAMEVILLEYTVIGFMPVMVAAATGALVVQFMFGREPILTVPVMNIQTLQEIPYVIFLGGMIGLLAVLFSKLMTLTLKWSGKTQTSYSIRLLTAGVLTGACAVFYPQVMGIGYDTVTQVLQGQLALTLLLGILVAKCLLTPVILGLGIPGGLIGPTFFIGAIAGGILGTLGAGAVDQQVAQSGFYAMLGMGSMMGAVANAPMAALVAIIELTGNPNIIFPAMISIVISNLIARYVFKQPSIFIASMQIQGLDYRFQPLNQLLSRSGVRSLMTEHFLTLEPELSWNNANDRAQEKCDWILISHNDTYTLLSPGDLSTAVNGESSKAEPLNLLEFPAYRLDTSNIAETATLQEALETMTEDEVDALCILDTQNHVCGILTRNQIEEHYRQS